ncbi:MAG: hypothetical protein K1X83_07690 [Oligoflexia bacterium]|nr:hypothetical protein [Oligoflexia bacterium]
MNTVDRLLEITSRIEHLENAAEWIARETVNTDSAMSQTGTLICVIAEDLREKVCGLVRQMEEILDLGGVN